MNYLKSNNFFEIYNDQFEAPKIIKKCLASFYILLFICFICIIYFLYFLFVIYKDRSLEASRI